MQGCTIHMDLLLFLCVNNMALIPWQFAWLYIPHIFRISISKRLNPHGGNRSISNTTSLIETSFFLFLKHKTIYLADF